MILNNKIAKNISIIIGLIFLYASINKFFELNIFYAQLSKSPLVPFGYNKVIGNITLILEVITCFLAFKNITRLSLLFSFGLMLFFTLYIGYLLFYSYYIPCSCGGILGNLSWESHLIFNLTLTIFAGAAYLIYDEK